MNDERVTLFSYLEKNMLDSSRNLREILFLWCFFFFIDTFTSLVLRFINTMLDENEKLLLVRFFTFTRFLKVFAYATDFQTVHLSELNCSRASIEATNFVLKFIRKGLCKPITPK